ncbi:MAG: N-acetylmuramoyl-L-alanine amidase [Firmicutes bacterium]|nr:N-acetylmuramoyl-L-alanine amidase [Bacillota bacterium]
MIFLFSLPAFAEVIGVVTGSGVNIRQGPGTDHPVIGVAAKNTAYPVLNKKDGWYQIRYAGGDPAWISATYLSTSQNSDLPQQIQTNGKVNVRSGPGTNYDVLGTAAANTAYQVVGEDGYWYKIAYGSGEGYVAKWLVSVKEGAPAQTDIQQPSAPQPDTQQPSTPQPADPGSGGQSAAASGATTGYVNTSVLNLRDGGSVSANIVSKLYQDAKVTVYKAVNGWYQVQTDNGLNGWVDGKYIRFPQGKNSVQTMKSAETPAFAGTASQGTIQVAYTKKDYGYRLTLTGDTVICYTYKGDAKALRIDTDMTIKGDFPNDSAVQFSVGGSLKNQLNIACDSSMYYRLSASADGKVLTVELGLNPLVGRLIYLDPGHAAISNSGEPDPGAIAASGLKEKDVTLDIALKAKALLEAKGATVELSRGETTTLTLGDRAYPANMMGADVLVSIHCNSSTNPSVNGTSVWYYAPEGNSAYDREKVLSLTKSLQNALLASAGRKNYGIYEANFAVLRASTMPAALVETAFLSNETEAQLLGTDSFRQKLAEGIAEGLSQYFSVF